MPLTRTSSAGHEARLLDLAYDAIFTLRLPDNVITYWNRGAEDLYGWRAAEALGQKSFELLRTIHDRPREEILDEVIRSGRWSGTIFQTRRDGTQMMVDGRWALETDDAGRPVAIIEINRDVTQLHATLSQLEFSNQVSAQLNSSLEPQAVLDRLLTLAVGAAQATHATVARIEGEEGVVEASQDAAGQRIPRHLRWRLSVPSVLEAVRTGKPTLSGPIELAHLAQQLRPYLGELPHRLAMPLAVGGQVIGLLLLGRRESPFSHEQQTAVERMARPASLALHNSMLFREAVRQKEAALRNERRLQAALEIGQELATEPELQTLLHNLLTRAISITEADEGSICRVDGSELIIEDALDAAGASARIRRSRVPISPVSEKALLTLKPAFADPQEVQEPFADGHPSADGSIRAMVIVPLSVAGRPIGLLSLIKRRPGQFTEDQVQDVGQLAAVAALLLQMSRLLQEAQMGEAAKREFLNMAGHELRTPLTVLKGYFSLMNDGTLGVAPDGWGHPLSVIQAELTTLERLVESLVVAARSDADQLLPSLRRVELNVEADAAVRRAQPRIELEGATCFFKPCDQPVAAMADPDHLARILDNLIQNSMNYSPAPARITVRVEAGPEPTILVGDAGIGIARDAHEKVFERFVRLGPSGIPTSPGSGLGLFISRKLARQMGGDVAVAESEPGKGTTMVVTLPGPGIDGQARARR